MFFKLLLKLNRLDICMMQLVTLVLVVLYAVRWGEIVSTLSSGIIKIPYGP